MGYFREQERILGSLRELNYRIKEITKLYQNKFQGSDKELDYFFNDLLNKFADKNMNIFDNLKKDLSIDMVKDSFDDFKSVLKLSDIELVEKKLKKLNKSNSDYDELIERISGIATFKWNYEYILSIFEDTFKAYEEDNKEKLELVAKAIEHLDFYNRRFNDREPYPIVDEVIKMVEGAIRAKDIVIIINNKKLLDKANRILRKDDRKAGGYSTRLELLLEHLDELYIVFH